MSRVSSFLNIKFATYPIPPGEGFHKKLNLVVVFFRADFFYNSVLLTVKLNFIAILPFFKH